MALPTLRTQLGIDPAAAEKNALRTMAGRAGNVLAQKKLASYDVDRQNMLADRAYQISRRPVLEAAQGLQVLRQLAPGMDMNMYLTNRDAIMQATGLPEVFLPTAEQIQANAAEGGETPEQSFESLKAAWSGQEAPSPEAPEIPKPDQRAFETWQLADGSTTNIRKGDPPPANAVKYKPGGEIIETDAKGNVRIVRGGAVGRAGQSELTKKSMGDLETKIRNASDHLARVQEIRASLKPEYLEAIPRLGQSWNAFLEKWGVKDLSPDEKKELTEITTFLRRTISNLNKHIKEVTGAQMSEKEAGRISLEEPKAGQSWVDFLLKGDSPTQFIAKVDDVELTLRAAIARYEWYRAKQMSPQSIVDLISRDAGVDLETIKKRLRGT